MYQRGCRIRVIGSRLPDIRLGFLGEALTDRGFSLSLLIMKLLSRAWIGIVFCLLAPLLTGEELSPRFGPFEAIALNSDVIRGVKVEDDGKIWILLNPAYRERELVVKISNLEGESYRKWFTGSEELVSPANQGKQANQWTDWIETKARYVEYWMSGQLILHLKRFQLP